MGGLCYLFDTSAAAPPVWLTSAMQRVVIFGKSLLLSGVAASLKRRTELQVSSFDPALPEAAERLAAFRPDVVVFDLASACPDSVIALWKAQPQLRVIGVDPAKDQVLVLSGETSDVLSAESLVGLIESQSGKK